MSCPLPQAATATVYLPVPPVARDDIYPQEEGATTIIPRPGALGNDSIPCGSQAVITRLTNPQHGTATLNKNGAFVYTPQAGVPQQDDFFTYEVCMPCGQVLMTMHLLSP